MRAPRSARAGFVSTSGKELGVSNAPRRTPPWMWPFSKRAERLRDGALGRCDGARRVVAINARCGGAVGGAVAKPSHGRFRETREEIGSRPCGVALCGARQEEVKHGVKRRSRRLSYEFVMGHLTSFLKCWPTLARRYVPDRRGWACRMLRRRRSSS